MASLKSQSTRCFGRPGLVEEAAAANRRANEKATAAEAAGKTGTQARRRRPAAAEVPRRRRPAAAVVARLRRPAAAAEEEVQVEEEEGEEEDARETFPVVDPGPAPPRAGRSAAAAAGKAEGGSVLGLKAPNGALLPSLPVAPVLQPPPAPLVQGVPEATLGALLKGRCRRPRRWNETAKAFLQQLMLRAACLPCELKRRSRAE